MCLMLILEGQGIALHNLLGVGVYGPHIGVFG